MKYFREIPYWKKGVFQCTMTSNPIRNKSFSLSLWLQAQLASVGWIVNVKLQNQKKGGPSIFHIYPPSHSSQEKWAVAILPSWKIKRILCWMHWNSQFVLAQSCHLDSHRPGESPQQSWRVPRDVLKRGAFYSCFRELKTTHSFFSSENSGPLFAGVLWVLTIISI